MSPRPINSKNKKGIIINTSNISRDSISPKLDSRNLSTNRTVNETIN